MIEPKIYIVFLLIIVSGIEVGRDAFASTIDDQQSTESSEVPSAPNGVSIQLLEYDENPVDRIDQPDKKITGTVVQRFGSDKEGWQTNGAWENLDALGILKGDVMYFPPGVKEGSKAYEFPDVLNPHRLGISLDYGWRWGADGQASDSISFKLLNDSGNGYVFKVHRVKSAWAVQWGKIIDGEAQRFTWSRAVIDATQPSVEDGGKLYNLEIVRNSDGSWSITGEDWNSQAGAEVLFVDSSVVNFNLIEVVGSRNSSGVVFQNIEVEITPYQIVRSSDAVPVSRFLDSLGVVTSMPSRGQPLSETAKMIEFAGFRWVRGGIAGLPKLGIETILDSYLDLRKMVDVKFSWGLSSGGNSITDLLESGKVLSSEGALIAFEGNNEPNNWGITYLGEKGGGKIGSWLPVAKLQRDLYKAVKSEPLLKKYPVWSISEGGAQSENVGLQYLTIPENADTIMPAGTRYADYANVHNYIYRKQKKLENNKTWHASDPNSTSKINGLFRNYGVTWRNGYSGYEDSVLRNLPRVTTETGVRIGDEITEAVHGLNLITMYFSQFKRGYEYTAMYLLRDRTDEGGNQKYGFFRPDYTPRLAALYLHNLTSILADSGVNNSTTQEFSYYLEGIPTTVHDILFSKRNGEYQLVIWNETLNEADEVILKFDRMISSVTAYKPTIGSGSVWSRSNVDKIRIMLDKDPLVLAISR